ncbi:MAG: septal ring lytic transglycosylase RlpA family protein [Dehalococcoidia bacterium]|jgi:rare lipoprotein A (peptidoglycan hydrolase)
MAKVALRAHEAQIVTQYAVSSTSAMASDGRGTVSQVSPAESNIAKMQPVQAVKAASAVKGSVRQGDAASVAASSGIATWYGGGDGFGLGDAMADGSPFNPNDPTIAASNYWPLGTWLTVCHGELCIRVCVRDRGGFGHAVDLSMSAFALLAPLSSGVIDVTVEAAP